MNSVSFIEKKELISSFNEFGVPEKRRELGREISEMNILLIKALSSIGLDVSAVSKVEELFNLIDGTMSESDYLTGLFEDLLNFKELLYTFFDNIVQNGDEQ